MTNGFKECGKAARCADPEIDDNLRANLREQENMSAHGQTWPRAHKCSVFDISQLPAQYQTQCFPVMLIQTTPPSHMQPKQ